jgi:AmmeMemoRadiSam system protein A
MQELGASFVTLYKGGALRGCIGTVEAFRPLVEDVAENAVRAAFADPRFPPLTIDELAMATLSLSLLSPPEPMKFRDRADFLSQLKPGRDGIIVEDQERRALFLPVVWSQLPDPADFLGHLWLKAGLARDHWSGQVKAWRFTATDYSEA